jgi:hypothetical protein
MNPGAGDAGKGAVAAGRMQTGNVWAFANTANPKIMKTILILLIFANSQTPDMALALLGLEGESFRR